MYRGINQLNLTGIMRTVPSAMATLSGSQSYPNIKGTVRFYQTQIGVLTVAEIEGLPTHTGYCNKPIFAFHIHEGESCSGNVADPFSNAGAHYNPYNCPHPHHAGDMPPLFGANGNAFLAFLTDRFTANEIIGKTVIIHEMPDDFRTQPSGNAGAKIACGEIEATRRTRTR